MDLADTQVIAFVSYDDVINKMDLYSDNAKQLAVSGLIGYLSGKICAKVGKCVAISLTGGALMMYLANRKGYISINKDKIAQDANYLRGSFERTEHELLQMGSNITKNNTCVGVGFFAGFVLGFFV